MLLLGSTAIATVSFIRLYFVQYHQVYARQMQEMMDLQVRERREAENRELQQKQETLRSGFAAIGSADGLSSLAQLVGEFGQLEALLARMTGADRMLVAQVPALAEETYRRGLSLLANVLELLLAIQWSNKRVLQAEADKLGGQIAHLRADDSQVERVRIREATLASHKNLLELIRRQELHAEEFLHKSDLSVAALRTTTMELAALKVGGSDIRVLIEIMCSTSKARHGAL